MPPAVAHLHSGEKHLRYLNRGQRQWWNGWSTSVLYRAPDNTSLTFSSPNSTCSGHYFSKSLGITWDNIYHTGTQAVPHKPAPLCTRHRTMHGQGCVITTELLKYLRPWRATQLAFKLRWGWDLTPQCWLLGNPYSSAGSACMARPKTHTDFIIIAILPPLYHQ